MQQTLEHPWNVQQTLELSWNLQQTLELSWNVRGTLLKRAEGFRTRLKRAGCSRTLLKRAGGSRTLLKRAGDFRTLWNMLEALEYYVNVQQIIIKLISCWRLYRTVVYFGSPSCSLNTFLFWLPTRDKEQSCCVSTVFPKRANGRVVLRAIWKYKTHFSRLKWRTKRRKTRKKIVVINIF